MSAAEIVVSEDVPGEAARRIAAAAGAGGHICLSGGSTPRAAYERAAALGVDWSGATLWFGDERCVGPGDERSNHRMASEALGEAATAHMRRMRGEDGPAAGADAYRRDLRDAGEPLPRFDLALMGLGPDGHTASLFPGKPELEERELACVGVPEAGMEPRVPRITLTLPAFEAAAEVLFLIQGEGKAEMVARAFGGDPDPAVPASLVRPREGRLVVLLDAPAAALLPVAGGEAK